MDVQKMNNVLNTEAKQYMVFKLGDDEYGVGISHITSIITPLTITRVPKASHYIKGVINLRGEIIPVMGFREKFDLSAVEETDETRIIIFNINDASLGGIVDAVLEVVSLQNSMIETKSSYSNENSQDSIFGVAKLDGRIVRLLDLNNLVDSMKDDN